MRLPLKILTIAITVFVLGLCSPVVDAAGADVYLVYAGRNRELKKAIIEGISRDFSVKTYNTSLLGLADYSGIQKVVGKISEARVVVMLLDTTMDAFKGSTIRTDLIVVNSVRATIKAENKVLYIVDTNADITELGKGLKTSRISSISDLKNLEADVIIIDESVISIPKVLITILNTQF